MVYVAVLGHGVVGSGVLEVMLNNNDSINKRAQETLAVKHILDIRDFEDLEYKNLFTKNFDDIINDDEVKIIVEVMGGITPAYDYVKASLLAGKSVVTSNKELVATKGDELIDIAKKNNVNFFFEASVGGGVPIIRPITQCLAANEVSEIAGILNGTTNFILTKMIREKMEFSAALALAQELGYAERDPSADVDGHDACRKICILADLVYGRHVNPNLVKTQGITKISLTDVDYAKAWGGVIKLIGNVKKLENGKINIFVAPMFIQKDSQLAGVDDVFNGILVRGDATGDVVFYGKGAGKLPTASAVVADVIDCVKHFEKRKNVYWDKEVENYIDYSAKHSFFIRAISNNKEEMINEIKAEFADCEFLQVKKPSDNEVGFTVVDFTDDEIVKKAEELKKLDIIAESIIKISDL